METAIAKDDTNALNYLYAAQNGLSTVIRGYFDADKVHQALNLPENEIVTFHQVIGYPQQ